MVWHSQTLRIRHLLKIILLLSVFIGLGKCSDGGILQCYKCSVTVEKYFVDNTTITTPLCSKFDESPPYIVQCPYSTMCLKTISALHLQSGQKQETITRGCAQQKNTTQVFRNRQWEQEHLVQEVYKEECKEIQSNNFAGSSVVHCYCRGELCNTSNFLKANGILIGFLISFTAFEVFNEVS